MIAMYFRIPNESMFYTSLESHNYNRNAFDKPWGGATMVNFVSHHIWQMGISSKYILYIFHVTDERSKSVLWMFAK